MALISSVSNERAQTLADGGRIGVDEITGGYRWGFAVAALFALGSVGVAWFVLRRDDVPPAAMQSGAGHG